MNAGEWKQKRAELEFVLDCLGRLASPSRFDLGSVRLDVLDFDWIVQFCEANRLVGFLAYLLRKSGRFGDLPASTASALVSGWLHSRIHQRLKVSQFRKLGSLLDEEGIPLAPLKGAALAHLVYTKLSVRRMADIDVLVRPHDVDRIVKLMRRNGLRPIGCNVNRWHDHILGRLTYGVPGIEIDLHLDPIYNLGRAPVRLEMERAWESAHSVPELGPNVFMLHPDDQFRHLLVHTLNRNSPSLVQVLDVMMFMQAFPGSVAALLDWAGRSLPLLEYRSVTGFLEALRGLIRGDGIPAARDFVEEFLGEGERRGYASPTHHDVFSRFRLVWALPSWSMRARFILGYLVPGLDAGSGVHPLRAYLRHWRLLVTKIASVWRRVLAC